MITATPTHAEAIASLLAVIGEHQSVLITSHARPDGDAIGSSLGLMHLLDSMGKDVTVAFSDPIPQVFGPLPGIDRIVQDLPTLTADLAIILECDSIARTGFDHINARIVINIDHHLSGRTFADYNWIDPKACAVGAMVYDLAIMSGHSISPAMASCLYAAVLTDTGGFTFSSTTAATFGLAQHLLESGADAHGVSQAVYFSNPPSKMRLLGIALNRMHIDGVIAWSWVTQEDMAVTGASLEDCEGVVNYLIGMAGICAAAFLRETPDKTQYRLSLRSKDNVDVAAVAADFAGGGHRTASGGAIDSPIEDAVERIVKALQVACQSAA